MRLRALELAAIYIECLDGQGADSGDSNDDKNDVGCYDWVDAFDGLVFLGVVIVSIACFHTRSPRESDASH